MRLLIFSGILYLIGVAAILSLRPSLMFTPEGIWKEFGLGRNPETHTWLPFWLFCIVWAVCSYLIMVILAEAGILPGLWVSHIETTPAPKGNSSRNAKPGYYMLNTEGSGIEGIPKYIYLGQTAPGMD